MLASAFNLSAGKLAENSRKLQSVLIACLVVVALCVTASTADAKSRKKRGHGFTPQSASFVMDAYSGRILYSNN
ncbi:MAG TPA: hypothetical protein VGN05_05095, partial [Parvibaculum sp.]